jgi:hypothetical protein
MDMLMIDVTGIRMKEGDVTYFLVKTNSFFVAEN